MDVGDDAERHVIIFSAQPSWQNPLSIDKLAVTSHTGGRVTYPIAGV